MSRFEYSVSPDDSIESALSLMEAKRVQHLPVLTKHKLVGVISERDLLRAALDLVSEQSIGTYVDVPPAKVRDFMVEAVYTVHPEDSLALAGSVMLQDDIGCLPVVSYGRIIGILTETDFVRHYVGSKKMLWEKRKEFDFDLKESQAA